VRSITLAFVVALLVGCSTVGRTPAPAAGPPLQPCVADAQPPAYDHVVWILMENHRRTDVIGSPNAPFETQLASACGTATSYAAVGSPSLPNYLALTSGSTHGVTDDAKPSAHPIESDNLFRQVRAAGGEAKSYVEAMPSPCATSSSGRYAVKHNPAVYYSATEDRSACGDDDVPLGSPDDGALAAALADGTLPELAVVVPDLCNDTHDCDVATGDAWLSRWVGAITSSSQFRSGHTVLFLAWDEPTPMPFIVVGRGVKPNTVSAAPADHYSLLRTTEELLGVPLLGAAASARSLRADFGL
jgi:hypothetical protein